MAKELLGYRPLTLVQGLLFTKLGGVHGVEWGSLAEASEPLFGALGDRAAVHESARKAPVAGYVLMRQCPG